MSAKIPNMTSRRASACQTTVITCNDCIFAYAESMHSASSSWMKWTASAVLGVAAVVAVAMIQHTTYWHHALFCQTTVVSYV